MKIESLLWNQNHMYGDRPCLRDGVGEDRDMMGKHLLFCIAMAVVVFSGRTAYGWIPLGQWIVEQIMVHSGLDLLVPGEDEAKAREWKEVVKGLARQWYDEAMARSSQRPSSMIPTWSALPWSISDGRLRWNTMWQMPLSSEAGCLEAGPRLPGRFSMA